MTTLVRNKPLSTDFLEGFWDRGGFDESNQKRLASTPAVNIREDKNHYVIELGAPGFDKDDITLSTKNDMLYIYGERKVETPEEDNTYSHREFNMKTFNRRFQLPSDVEEDHINANFKNGMLMVNIPKHKSKASSLRKIEIQ
ncbi:MAG: Hsp20/alpha crystallin family protein [Cyclobacteriaceae bacterium]